MTSISEKSSIGASPIIEEDDQPFSSDSFVQYSLFSLRQRITIILIVSSVSILSSLSSALYTPALPKMAVTLGVSISAVNFTITTYLLLQGLLPIFSSSIGDSLGRRTLYSATLTIYIGACIGLSITDAYPVVLVLCGLLAAGAAPNTALGAGVIGDLVPASQRGGYMGLYNAGIGLGDAVGPVLGGAFAQFTGYHGIFIFLLAVSAALLTLVVVILPETLHSIVGNGSILPKWYLRPLLPVLLPDKATTAGDPSSLSPVRRLDIFGPVRLLKQPDVLCCLTLTGVCYMVWQMSMVATSAQYSSQYHLNEFAIGLTYISNGIGELVGSLLMGKVLDHEYRKQLRREAAEEATSTNNVVLIGRARLYSLRLPIPMFIGSIVAFGWVIKAHTHIAVPVVLAFLIGWSVQSILTALATLLVDLFEDQSSTATATFIMTKGLMGAVGSSSIQPLINAIGTGWTFTALGGLCILALPSIFAEFYFGGGWRLRRTKALQHDEPLEKRVSAEYQHRIIKTESLDFDSTAPVSFPADFLSQVGGHSHHHYGVVNGTVANNKIITALSEEYRNTPLSVVLVSALYVTIFRITGQEGGALGYKSSGASQPQIISFALDPKISAMDLHIQVRKILSKIVQPPEIQNTYSPLPYQVVLSIINSFTDEPLTSLGCEWQIRFDAHGVKTRVHYSRELFNHKSVEMFIGVFARVLKAFTLDTSMHIDQLPLCTSSDLHEINKWNHTHRKLPEIASIGELFKQIAGQQSTDLAIVNSDGSLPLTFSELDRWSDALAQWLIRKGYGGEQETIIGVWQTRSSLLVVSFLACLKAGCVYMPIEMTLPKERIRYMLTDTLCPMVLMNGYTHDFPCADVVDYTDLAEDELQSLMEAGPALNGPTLPMLTSNRLSHVIFTSGSTGLPKAVMIQHSCLLNFISTEYKPITRSDRTAVMLNIAFDVSSGEIWYPLTHGATLVCYVHTPTSPVDIHDIASFLTREKITSFAVSTAVFKLLVDADFFQNSLPLLRSVDLVGEAAYLEFVQPVLLARPDLAVYNCYGPSESTIYATTFQVPVDYCRTHIAIGRPMANIGAYIVDEALQPVPRGVSGELLLTGSGLARGYLNRPELTAEKFIHLETSHPFGPNRAYRTGDIVRWTTEGELVFIHRKEDGQVKIRGQRLELGEIEQVMKQHPDVISAAAALVKVHSSDRIVTYAVLKSKNAESADEQVLDLWDDHFNNEDSPYHSLHAEDGGQRVVQWYSMFDAQPIPSSEMVQWLDDTIDQIAPAHDDRVLEVGVGSGMIALQIAPGVQSFVGTDLSTPSLKTLEAQLSSNGLLSKVSLFTTPAHDLGAVAEKHSFSLIILNSVLQYFPSGEYLAQVLAKMVELIDSSGRIFVGDVRSYSLIPFHDLERALANLEGDASSAEIQSTLSLYAEGQTELLVDPAFFFNIKRRMPKVAHVEIKPKLMSAQNELSRYRYNVVLHVNKQPRLSRASTWFDCASPEWTTEDLVMRLSSSREDTVGALAIPIASIRRIQEVLDSCGNESILKRSVDDIRHEIADDPLAKYSTAADIVQIAKKEGWNVVLDYTLQHGPTTSFRAIFERVSTSKDEAIIGDFPDVSFHGPSHNTPSNTSTTVVTTDIVSLEKFLRERLPAYMVPSQIISVAELPLTRSGKVDRKLLASSDFLAQHDSDMGHVSHAIQGPSTIYQREVLELFSRALNRPSETIDITDSLFALGGHSLMATLLVSAIRREMGVSLSMTDFYREPSVDGMAKLIAADKKSLGRQNTVSVDQGATIIAGSTIVANRQGPNPTIFMFHEVTGFASVYATAFENIRHKLVVFGDEHWGKSFREGDSIHELARNLLDEVREFQPNGPYHLAGWSFGGYLAFEIARQMQEAGEEVAILMMFDSYVYHEPLQSVEWSDDLQHLLQVHNDKAAWVHQFSRIRTLISRYEGPMEAYTGKSVLVKALKIAEGEEADYPHSEDPYNGWREYIPRLERRSIEATHRTMFNGENGPKMGAIISEIMMSI